MSKQRLGSSHNDETSRQPLVSTSSSVRMPCAFPDDVWVPVSQDMYSAQSDLDSDSTSTQMAVDPAVGGSGDALEAVSPVSRLYGQIAGSASDGTPVLGSATRDATLFYVSASSIDLTTVPCRKCWLSAADRKGGTTSLQPGLQRIAVKLRLRSAQEGLDAVPESEKLPGSDLIFDPQTGLPPPSVFMPVIDAFAQNVGQFFPSINRQEILQSLAE